MTRARRDRQHLRNDVEVARQEERRLLGLAFLVLIEGGVVVLNARILPRSCPGAVPTFDKQPILPVHVRGARRNGLVLPPRLVDTACCPRSTRRRSRATASHPACSSEFRVAGARFSRPSCQVALGEKQVEGSVRLADRFRTVALIVYRHKGRARNSCSRRPGDVAHEVAAGSRRPSNRRTCRSPSTRCSRTCRCRSRC